MAKTHATFCASENKTMQRDQSPTQSTVVVLNEKAASDDKTLGTLGYKQEFKRDFTLWETFAVSFSVLGILPSIAATLSYNLGSSGTAGAIWGWLIAALCIQCTGLAMAELCSSMPTAGGLYYASAVLAPQGWGRVCSWFVGYSNLVGFGIAPLSINYAFAAMSVTAGQIAHPSYSPQTWHIYLILMALCIMQGVITMQSTRVLGWINKISTIFNIIVVLIFIIWFPVGSIGTPKTNSNEVWTTFTNGTDWPTGWAVIIGFEAVLYSLAGYDTSFHLSEECANSNIAGPRSIVMTVQAGLYLGWAIILVICYTVKDIEQIVNSPYGQPFGSLCLQVLGPNAGLAMFVLNLVARFLVGQGCTVAASRVIFAFARDGAIPGSRWLSHVNNRTKTPVNAVWILSLISALLGLLMFASTAAINAVFTLAAIGQYTSFTFPILLKLLNEKNFKPGPWNLGRWSRPVGMVAVGWWLLILPALCFPAVKAADLTLLTMNWTCVLYGGSMTLAMLYYAVSGRKWFTGPRANIQGIASGDIVYASRLE